MTKEIDLESALKALNGFTIDGLTSEQVKRLFQKAAEQKAITDILQAARISTIDIDHEIKEFLETRKSKYTRMAYRVGINRWLAYCKEHRIDPRVPSVKDADLYAASLRAMVEKETIKASTANINIDAVSSFYASLQKYHGLSSPFIGIERASRSGGEKHIPTQSEIDRIKAAMPKHYHAAIDAMTYRGFRVGALNSLHVKPDGAFTTTSKGKAWTGHLPAGLTLAAGHPFRDIRAGSLQKAFQRASIALHKAGKIDNVYSVHDLRHVYACNEYTKDKDIYRVKTLLNHDNIAITERYLKGLNVL
jgi:site-specific recombinase XerC